MRLYKYLHPDRIDVLRSGRICFSSPSNLNDPFELKAPFQFYETEDELTKRLKALIPKAAEEAMSELPAEFRTPRHSRYLSNSQKEIFRGLQVLLKLCSLPYKNMHTVP